MGEMHLIRIKSGQTKKLILYSVLGCIILLLPVLLSNYSYGIMLLCFAELYIVAVSGFDVLYGYSGQISMGHAGFFAIGAYSSVLLRTHTGLPVLLTMFFGAIIAAIVGAILAYPASKLKFAFLALSTIAFNEIVYQIITRSPGAITGDFLGISTDPVSIFGLSLKPFSSFYYFGLFSVVIFVGCKLMLVRSKVGRALLAIKQSTSAADGMGIDVRKYKIIAFAFSAFYVAFAGAMYAHMVGFISPETFTRKQSLMFMTMLLFGGVASDWGPLVGAVGILLLNEALRDAERYSMLLYGALILVFIILLPGGVIGEGKKLLKKIAHRKEVKKLAGN